jgi:RNA polymerase sigma factor (sigma-70 family)
MHFEEVVKRISPKLKGIAYKLNGRFSFFNEEDLYQEALIHLWLDFKQGKLSDKTDSYILQGCYFHIKNYIRKNYDRANLISLENMTNEEGKIFDLDNILSLEGPDSCFELINCKMLIEKINNNGLTKREKEVFCLALEGLTTREIGSRLGISHVRVVKLKGRIKDKCRKYRDNC